MPSRITIAFAAVVLVASAAPGAAHADDWDRDVPPDDTASTDNVLFHGSRQVHDLGVQNGSSDQDWYLVVNKPFSSYQMVVDGLTPDLNLNPSSVQRLNVTGGLVLETATAIDDGGVLSLQWEQPAGVVHNLVRVRGAACGFLCTPLDTYRIRFYDTTYTLPRFNNSGTQSTVMLVQNTTDRSCSVTHHYFSASGGVLATSGPSPLAARGLQVVPTAAVVGGTSGSVRVTHTCGYGGLSGKAVALEPSTGFTFDTPLVPRPR